MPDNSGTPGGTSTPPANLTELEIAFARDPSSDAFIPLCEAYLSQKRFMEAMVLGKKAVKARPEDKARRLLLVRVYEEQGKLPKAIEEAVALVNSDPTYAAGHHTVGRLHQKANNKDAAITAFKAAVDVDDYADSVAALKALGVEYRKAAPAPPPPPAPAPAPAAPAQPAAPAGGVRPAAAAQATPATRSVPPGAGARATSVSGRQPAVAQPLATPAPSSPATPAPDSAPPPAETAPAAGGEALPEPAPRPRPRPRPRPALTEADLGINAAQDKPAAGASGTLKLAAGGVLLLGLLIGGMTVYKNRQEKLNEYGKKAREALAQDSLPSLKESLASFTKMLEVSSGQPLASGGVAYIHAILYTQYGLTGEKDAAEKFIKKAENDGEDVSLTHVARAMLMLKDGKAQEALNLLEEKQKKLGDNPALLVVLGDALLATGKLEEAGKAYQSARERSSKEARGLWASGEYFRLTGRERDALGNFDSVIRMDKEHLPSRLGRVFIRLDMGSTLDIENARADMVRLKEQAEGVGQFYSALVSVADLEVQRITGQVPDLKKHLESLDNLKRTLGPNPDLLMAIARTQMDQNKAGDAAKALQELVSKYPTHLSGHLALARALIADGKADAAEQAVVKAQDKVGKNNLDLAIMVGVARRAKRDFKGAEEAFKKAFEIARDHPRIQLEMARNFSEQKKYGDAINLLKTAIGGASDQRPAFQAELFCETANVLLQQGGNTELALNSVDQAVKVDPFYADAHYWRGMVLKAAKKNDDARASFQKYLDKAPAGALADKATRERDALR